MYTCTHNQVYTDVAVSSLLPPPLLPLDLLEEVAELSGHLLLSGVASIIQIPDTGQQR